jgi:hypothetical protein
MVHRRRRTRRSSSTERETRDWTAADGDHVALLGAQDSSKSEHGILVVAGADFTRLSLEFWLWILWRDVRIWPDVCSLHGVTVLSSSFAGARVHLKRPQFRVFDGPSRRLPTMGHFSTRVETTT